MIQPPLTRVVVEQLQLLGQQKDLSSAAIQDVDSYIGNPN